MTQDETFLRRSGMTRRQFNLMFSGAVAGSVVLPTLVKPAYAQPTQFNEAPMLAERVAAGELPPVAERLPPNPVVVTPTNEIGTYGGRMFGAGRAPETANDLQIGQVAGLFRYSNDLNEIYPELAEGYQFNDDFTECTITLRPGIKWSDGEPFTVDDIVFYFEDWQYDSDLLPVPSATLMAGGELFSLEKLDDHTIKFGFAVPHPAFSIIHFSGGPSEPFRPAHYLRQFHPKYNPDAAAEATAAGFNSWQTRFTNRANSAGGSFHNGASNIDMPVLSPWIPTSVDSQRQQYERNPYFFKVDTEGNQLPYVDYMTVEYASNAEVMNLKAVSGELSVAGMDIQLSNFPIIRRGEETGNYKTKLVYSERGSDVCLAFNQIHPDPVLSKLFTDVRFRQAMSLGINRTEINELVFLGQGTIRQATVNESASFFEPRWAEHYVAYDPDAANALLDEIGLSERNADGVRLREDGVPLTFQLEFLPHEGPKTEVCELVVKHWQALGIQVQAAARERSYLIERLDAQQQDATAWHADRLLERPAYAYGLIGKMGPGGDSIVRYGKLWQDWFNSGGERGTEPPQEAKDLRAAYVAWQETEFGSDAYMAAAKQVYDLTTETLWVIGTVGQSPQPVIVRNDMGNVFRDGDETRFWWGAANWFWHTLSPEQWYIKA
ncbi:hypothetical protein VE25_07560 [Devosia geojensis]|uniref:Solute-binding protein family 5 domain-containing protein n=1 Tax=Devosia geojensis TaxID=443610 RepID=A0A0F5FU49_9HYPH|nr:ABC transporter substrate-binding protein [Devosia geojensis]KKB12399.1 hypothetical protein VE25_07560 [Devosia geojensis]